MSSLAEELPKEQARVRKIVTRYRDPLLKGAGELAARMMEADLARAEKASAEGDVAAMAAAYQSLKEYSSDD